VWRKKSLKAIWQVQIREEVQEKNAENIEWSEKIIQHIKSFPNMTATTPERKTPTNCFYHRTSMSVGCTENF
jgi:hypothetical protein